MNKSNLAGRVTVLTLGVILLSIPLFVKSKYILHLFIISGLATVLATSNRLMIKSGLWFLAQAAFYAIGAYSLLLLRSKLGLGFWFAFPLAGVATGMVAFGLGYATSKVKELYFCIITVAFVEVVRLAIIKAPFLGSGRAVCCPPPEPFLGIEFTSKVPYYYLMFAIVAITLLILHLVERSRVGLILNTIAESEPLAESIGIDAAKYKISTMSLCCFFAGLAGAFYAPYVAVLSPASFTLAYSIMILMYAIVGGMGSIWGPVIGATFLTVLPEFLSVSAGIKNILFATIVLLVLFFLPAGIVSVPQVVRQAVVSRTSGKGRKYNNGNTPS